MRFDEMNLTPELLDGLEAMNFKEATPIQEQTMPIVLNGSDLLACAQTGTGKTAAYLLPILNILCQGKLTEDKINVLIMVPTRELAQQIDQQLEAFAYFVPVSSVAVYGGGDGRLFDQQNKALRAGVDVVIATPGRLIALLNMGHIDLSKVSFFVLDEADRMLDMGFVDDIMHINSYLPPVGKRQTLLFSATMAPKIEQLAQKVLHHPESVKLSTSKPADKIDQSAYICYEAQKLELIKQILKADSPDKVIVFSSSKQKVKEIYKTFRSLHLKVAAMHSDLEQKDRDEVIRNFKNGHVQVLVATDIVARGIDIEDIDMVVNYDVPHDVEDYVHRVGRTARANKGGTAITFVAEKDQFSFGAIEKFIEKDIRKPALPEALGDAPAYNPGRRFKEARGKNDSHGNQRHRKFQHSRPKRNTQKQVKSNNNNQQA
ncbi:MAG: DEAD/DEAH box helicase [Paludibacteraceae bacterium]|nr:DEAD/DEAH box helicase [Paludibacteraceae bacterium]